MNVFNIIAGVAGAACAAKACAKGLSPKQVRSYRSLSLCLEIFKKSGVRTGTIGNTAAFVFECEDECYRISKTDAYKKNCECP